MRLTLLKSKFGGTGRAEPGATVNRDLSRAKRCGGPAVIFPPWRFMCGPRSTGTPTCSIADLEHARI
jgi:hypothetical protein